MRQPDQQPCPGHHTPERPAPGLRPGEQLCHHCVRRAEHQLTEIAALAGQLDRVTIARLDRVQHAAGAARRAPDQDWRGTANALPATPWPANVDAAERGREVLELLFEWADHVAAWHRIEGLPAFTRHVPLAQLAGRAAAVLVHHSRWMRDQQQGPDLAHAIWCVRRDLRQLVDTQPARLYAGPCGADLGYGEGLGYRCGLPLYQAWGRDTIRCDGHRPSGDQRPRWNTGCGAGHEVTDRQVFLRASVDGALLPLKLLWQSLHVLVGQPASDVAWKVVEAWTRPRTQRVETVARSGRKLVRLVTTPPRLTAAGVDLAGRPLYRGGDVLQLAEDGQRRRGRRRITRAAS